MTNSKGSQKRKASLSALSGSTGMVDVALVTATGTSGNHGAISISNGFAAEDVNMDLTRIGNGIAAEDFNSNIAISNGIA